MTIALLLLIGNCVGVVLVSEAVTHPPRVRHNTDIALPAHNIEVATHSTSRQVSITTPDGAVLKAWWMLPPAPTERAVIVCHGIADSAMGSIGFAPLFLRNGYAVLVPESRGHGASTGLVTFGLREADDLARWFRWTQQQGSSAIYGVGESLGGAIVLQSLTHGANFRAVMAESAYASFTEVADFRVGKVLGPLLAPLVVRECMLYVLLRYHANLWNVDAAAAVATTPVPILLIHGLTDDETPPENSRRIASRNPAIQLWLVPGTGHTGAYAADPAAFEARLLEWFKRY